MLKVIDDRMKRLKRLTNELESDSEKSLAEIPDPLMLWQRHFAQVLDGLVEAGAGAIGVDFIFSDIGALD